MITSLQQVTVENEESANLSKWLGILTHLNGNKPIKKELTTSIEQYYDYYWSQDKNYAIKAEDKANFSDDLQIHQQTEIYKGYLFADFIYMFRIPFRMTKDNQADLDAEQEVNKAFYGWEDTQYSQFMMQILSKLEPRFYQADDYILLEGDEVNEQIFVIPHTNSSTFQKLKVGKYTIGFTEGNKRYFHLKFGKSTIVGGYENTFAKNSLYFYKALNFIDAYGLRTESLMPIMDKFPKFHAQYSTYMVDHYHIIINKPMLNFKHDIITSIFQGKEGELKSKEVERQLEEAEKTYHNDFKEIQKKL